MKTTEGNERIWSGLAHVLGYLAVKDLKTLEQRVEILARLGYSNQDIAKICGTTPLSVSVRKASLSKKRHTKNRPKRK